MAETESERSAQAQPKRSAQAQPKRSAQTAPQHPTPMVSRRSALKGLGGAVAVGALAGPASGPAAAALATPAAPVSPGLPPVAPNPPAAPGAPIDAGRAAQPMPLRDPVIEWRIETLLRRMTPAEKLGQLRLSLAGSGSQAVRDAVRAGAIGSVFGDLGSAGVVDELQHIAVEQTRLGIPLLVGFDVIHGYLTTFPIPLAQASSFDPTVAGIDAGVAAMEAASAGIRWTYAPMVDVSREPRWGRMAEGYGEDPYLSSAFAAAKVRGYQGDNYAAPGRLAACAKHFAAYGGAEGGRDYNTVDVSQRRLRDVYLPPFVAAVRAGVATVMAAFNTIDGVPAHANRPLLTDLLKGELGFDGFVVSDYEGVSELVTHGVAEDAAAAGVLALTAGVDMEMASTTYAGLRYPPLAARIDDAVRRVLRIKFRAGLFDRPYTDPAGEITAPAQADREQARRVGARSMVLVHNPDRRLPLRRDTSSIAVIGPLGDDTAAGHGTWAGPGAGRFPAVSVLAGIRAAAPAAAVTFTPGCTVTGAETGGIAAAVAAARAADVVIAVVGESADLSGEAASRSDIGLPGVQGQLLAAVRAAGRPVVTVVMAGRPLVLGDVVAASDAVLIAWHAGIESGNAVADVLFGAVNPGGKLPVSLPRSVGQLPIYYAHEPTGRPADPENKNTSKYLDLPSSPLFEFGFGLSYTSFTVTDLRLSRSVAPAAALRNGSASIDVTATVTNTGDRAGDEVVQLYLHDPVASLSQPVRRLRGFTRVGLDPGQSAPVRFRLTGEDIGFFDNTGRFLIEPGQFEVYLGTSSAATMRQTFTLT